MGALMLDSTVGSMVAALLVGPCALDYSKAKTLDNYFFDPPADELLQRHRIHSRGTSCSQMFTDKFPRNLQSNSCNKPMRGYLSLHETYDGSTIIKWMPNELVHSNSDVTDFLDASNIWNNAICLNVKELVYIHVHNKGSDGGSIVFIGADGIQYAPIHFPAGQHPLAFISCIENSIESWGHLEPPLWVQNGLGKVLPKLRRRSSSGDREHRLHGLEDTEDYVFRIQRRKTSVSGTYVPVTPPSSAFPSPAPSSTAYSSASRFERFSARLRQRWRSSTVSVVADGSGSGTASQGALTPGTQSPSALSMTSLATSSPQLGCHVHIDACLNMETSHDVDLDLTGLSSTVTPSGERVDVKSTTEVSQPHLFVSQKSSPGRLFSDESESPARLTLRSAFCSMRHQILSRAFCGWLAHCKNMSTIRTHLKDLVRTDEQAIFLDASMLVDSEHTNNELTIQQWSDIRQRASNESTFDECCRFVYFGGIQRDLRPQLWPYLLGFHRWTDDETAAAKQVQELTLKYKNVATEWMAVDAIAHEKDREAFRIAVRNQRNKQSESKQTSNEICNGVEKFDMDNSPACDAGLWSDRMITTHRSSQSSSGMTSSSSSTPAWNVTPRSPLLFNTLSSRARSNRTEYLASLSYESTSERSPPIVGVTDNGGSMMNSDSTLTSSPTTGNGCESNLNAEDNRCFSGDGGQLNGPSGLEDSNVYSKDLVDLFAVNIHRIDKDVHRCDRNHPYFTSKHNMEKLRNVMCTYAWEHLETGYIQGMCDLAAPLLVVFDDEVLTYGCFIIVMNRLIANFPNGQGMETNLACLRSLLQVMDPELFDLMQRNGDSNHFYFCYRWFLLDFKRGKMYVHLSTDEK